MMSLPLLLTQFFCLGLPNTLWILVLWLSSHIVLYVYVLNITDPYLLSITSGIHNVMCVYLTMKWSIYLSSCIWLICKGTYLWIVYSLLPLWKWFLSNWTLSYTWFLFHLYFWSQFLKGLLLISLLTDSDNGTSLLSSLILYYENVVSFPLHLIISYFQLVLFHIQG